MLMKDQLYLIVDVGNNLKNKMRPCRFKQFIFYLLDPDPGGLPFCGVRTQQNNADTDPNYCQVPWV